MGQSSSSCFADNTDGNTLRLDAKNRTSFHPLSSQDAEIHRNKDNKSISVSSGPIPLTGSGGLDTNNFYAGTGTIGKSIDSEAHNLNIIPQASSKDTIDTTTSSIKTSSTRGSNQKKSMKSDNNQDNKWKAFPTLEEEDTVGAGNGDNNDNTHNTKTTVDKQFSNSIPSYNPLVSKKKTRIVLSSSTKKADKISGDLRQRKLRFIRWKKKDFSTKLPHLKSATNGIMTLKGVDAQQKMMYYFPRDRSKNSNMNQLSAKKGGRHDASAIEIKASNDDCNPRMIVEYTGSNQTATKLVTRDMFEVKTMLLNKIHNRLKKDTYLDPILVCGTQIFATRYDVDDRDYDDSNNDMGTDIRPSNSDSLIISVEDVNPAKVSSISSDNFNELLRRTQSFENELFVSKESRGGRFKPKKALESRTEWMMPPNQLTEKGSLLSATVSLGVGRKLFTERAVLSTSVESVPDMICVSKENKIFVCDIGLTSSRCDFIVDTAERCSKGSYNAYTYAKQTLGCREFDELAVVCEWPVMRAISSIREHLEEEEKWPKRGCQERAPLYRRPKQRTLVLDEREPHIVKYDVSRRERQKLDMHTDKSEWTFLIALTDGGGDDYDGGGTYFECIDSTVHLEKGHALIFPGRLRHRGQKIINGKRFLLVGFLVEKQDDWGDKYTLSHSSSNDDNGNKKGK